MFKYCATCERYINRISKMTLKSKTGKNLRMGTLATCWLSTKELTIEKIMTMPNVAIYDDSYKSKYIDTLLYESENRSSNIQISLFSLWEPQKQIVLLLLFLLWTYYTPFQSRVLWASRACYLPILFKLSLGSGMVWEELTYIWYKFQLNIWINVMLTRQ